MSEVSKTDEKREDTGKRSGCVPDNQGVAGEDSIEQDTAIRTGP